MHQQTTRIIPKISQVDLQTKQFSL